VNERNMEVAGGSPIVSARPWSRTTCYYWSPYQSVEAVNRINIQCTVMSCFYEQRCVSE